MAPNLKQRLMNKNGQAMIEFLLGLVGIMFLLVGLLQARELSWRSSQMNLDMRANIAEQMLGKNASSASGEMVYSEGHDMGNDDLMYTDDDIMLSASGIGFSDLFLRISGHTRPSSRGGKTSKGYLNEYDLHDPYLALELTSGNISEPFDMIYQDAFEDVTVLPFVQSLLGKKVIKLQSGIWMPELGDIMSEP